MNTLSALAELKRYVTGEISGYRLERLTKHSTVEYFSTNDKYFKLLRCNATAIMLVRDDGYNNIIGVQRVCEIHNLNKNNSKAIQKFCLEIGYLITYQSSIKTAPKWGYIKEHLINYVQVNPLNWAIDSL